MRNAAMSALLLLLSASASFGADFRTVSWFMSRDQVMSAEGNRRYEPGAAIGDYPFEGISYHLTIDGYNGRPISLFGDEGLVAAGYLFGELSAESPPTAGTMPTLPGFGQGAFHAMNEGVTDRFGLPMEGNPSYSHWRTAATEITLPLERETSQGNDGSATRFIGCLLLYAQHDSYADLHGWEGAKASQSF